VHLGGYASYYHASSGLSYSQASAGPSSAGAPSRRFPRHNVDCDITSPSGLCLHNHPLHPIRPCVLSPRQAHCILITPPQADPDRRGSHDGVLDNDCRTCLVPHKWLHVLSCLVRRSRIVKPRQAMVKLDRTMAIADQRMLEYALFHRGMNP
jgi:hypothetical protein